MRKQALIFIAIIIIISLIINTILYFTKESIDPINPNYKIKIIEGCEYIEFDKGIGQSRIYIFTHKGNCKNHK